MHPRTQAIQLLEQARDILADRLVERVLESRREIMDDAYGNTYVSEIEQIFEQIGSRLNHVNALLANMPSSPAEAAEDSEIELVAADEEAAPETSEQPSGGAASFPVFLSHILAGELNRAARVLADLFGSELGRCEHWTKVFAQRSQNDPELTAKVLQLRTETTSGSLNSALMLLWECFDLQGVESLSVLQSLRTRLIADPQSRVGG